MNDVYALEYVYAARADGRRVPVGLVLHANNHDVLADFDFLKGREGILPFSHSYLTVMGERPNILSFGEGLNFQRGGTVGFVGDDDSSRVSVPYTRKK